MGCAEDVGVTRYTTSHNPGGSGSWPSIDERVIHPVRNIIKHNATIHTKTPNRKCQYYPNYIHH